MYDSVGEYVKRSFRNIFDNPTLFIPMILNLLTILIPVGIILLFPGMKLDTMSFPPSMGLIAAIIIVAIITLLLQLLIKAGKLHMLKEVVLGNEITIEDFFEGIRRYTGKLFLGALLIMGVVLLCFLVMIPIGIAIGSKSIFIMIVLAIPLIAAFIFISFWETILVYEDCGVTESFSLSFAFAKSHFGLVLIINIVRGILTGNGNGNNNRSRSSGGSVNFSGFFNFSMPYMMNNLGLISFIAIIGSVIKAIFALYFEMMFFVIYHDRRSSIVEVDEDDFTLNNDFDKDDKL